MKRVCIFVDGENLRHAIIDLFQGIFDQIDYLPKNAQWGKFYDWLAKQTSPNVERVRTYWYVIEHLDFFPYKFLKPATHSPALRNLLSGHDPHYKELLDKTSPENLQTELEKIVSELRERKSKMRNRFEGWLTIQNGIAKRHEAIEFRRAGASCYNLFDCSLGSEKAVDVKLATDMIILHEIYDIALIVSGDQDYVPAVQVIKDYGKRVINVVFKRRDGSFLPTGAWRLNLTTDTVLEVEYNQFKNYLQLP
ncbi:MAG: NYN domain-containing protein [candidate division WOR-3 bacterium]|nr:NYN domain-containing protein [candidate division WOR-3 bacterium]